MKLERTWVAIFSLLTVLVVISNTAFVVDQRERALLFQMGEIKRTDFKPGLHFKLPFVQSVRKFDGRILTLDNQTENFLTAEKKNVEVDYYVKWRVADSLQYYRATAGQALVAADRLSTIINQGLRDQFGARTIQQAINTERDAMMTALEKSAAERVGELGIQVVDVRIKSINLPTNDNISGSVYERMRAERSRVAADLRARGAEEAEKIRASADTEAQTTLANAYRDAEKLRGEGDAEAAAIYAKAYGTDAEFYRFYRSLAAYRESFGGKNDVMVLEPKGEFFRTFNNGAAR